VNGTPSPEAGSARELGRFLEIQTVGLNLPFALGFLLTASGGVPSWTKVVLILVAFFAARNAGHSFNRWADREYDAANPRTRNRALPRGRFSPAFALGFTALNAAIFLVAAFLLNLFTFLLAPIALALLLGYSYTKRVSAGTTVFLGLVQAVIPGAVYIAVQGALPWSAVVAVLAVLCWGTAFETIHSLGDVEIDRALGLRSIPVALGVPASVRLVPVLHLAALLLLAGFGYLAHLGIAFGIALAAVAACAGWTDWMVARRPTEPRVPFQLHFLMGCLLLAGIAAALFVPGLR
jgi:4-hydroxybenzoate polyprenyltransferase